MKRVLLIDLSHLFWTFWHATADLELGAAYERTIGTIQKIREGFDFVAVCCDAPPYLRKEILPAYKSQRDAPPPVAIEQLNRVKERCEADGLLVWACRGFEADDLIATVVADLITSGPAVDLLPKEYAVVVGSNDKDLLQLVTDDGRVTVLSPLKGETFDRAKVIEKFGVSPDMLGDLLALWGDASDNIPGVPGVAVKTGAKLLLEFGTLEGVLTHTDDIPQLALRRNLEEHGPAARLARKLVTLRTDAPIDVAELFKTREVKKLVETEMEDAADVIGSEVKPPAGIYSSALAASNAEGAALAGAADGAAYGARSALANRNPNEMATYQGPEFERGLEPATLEAAWRLSGAILNSRLYPRFQNREAIFSVILRGREMGLGALTALDMIHFFEGKPALHTHLIAARAKQHPDCEYFTLVESTPEKAVYSTKRRGNPDPTTLTYTLEQAKQAGLCPDKPRTRNPTPGEKDRRGNWEKRPEEMLRKTAATQLARVEFPEALLGAYAIEELSPDHGE